MVPELPEDQDAADADAMEEDAADADARRKAVQKAREEAELRKRSQVDTILLPMCQLTAHMLLMFWQFQHNILARLLSA